MRLLNLLSLRLWLETIELQLGENSKTRIDIKTSSDVLIITFNKIDIHLFDLLMNNKIFTHWVFNTNNLTMRIDLTKY